MRWYKIVTDSQTWDATNDPNALNVELDIPIAPDNAPKSAGFVRVWGIPLQTLLNAKSFNQQKISIYGGMQQGLPLANPNQQGLLLQGVIQPALGNWIGTDMTLDFYVPLGGGEPNPAKPANVIHNWQPGQPLATAMQQTLSTGFPGFTPKISISPNLIQAFVDTGFYQTLGQYATYIYGKSRGVMNSPTYQGVHISVQGKTIVADDGTQAASSIKMINFQDLIGQPIWTGAKTIQFKCVMRGDIGIGTIVQMPNAAATLTPASGTAFPGSSASNTIQGQFRVIEMRHTGNFRQPDWASWCTTVTQAVPVGA